MKSTLKQLLRQDFAQYVRPHFEKSECEVCGSDTECLHVHHMTYFQDLLDNTLKQLHLEYHEDTDDYTDEELQLIRDIMIGKQMKIEYVTCCEPCHLELHEGSYRRTTKTKDQLELERKEKEERQKRREERLERKRQQELKEQQKLQEQETIYNNVLQKLTVGSTYKNWNFLCEALGVEVKPSGSPRIGQMKDFKQYFDWEKQGQKITITEIYDTPKERENGRKNNGKSEASLKALNEHRGHRKRIRK